MDLIRLEDIHANGRHGALPGERDAPQRLDIALQLEVDLHAAQRSDNLNDTVDYGALRQKVTAVVETTSFKLIERLAGEVLHALFEDPRIARAEITIAKPKLLDGATPSITLKRDNPLFSKR